MNNDENTPQPQPWIDPALEARVVAGVLGETSAFEAAELDHAVAENPELAIFKRRIEAVHDLVATAVRPDKPRLQLSPERREKILATLGVSRAEPKKKVAIFTLPPPAWWSSSILIRIAACFVIGAIFVTFLSSVVIFKSASEPPELVFEGASGGFVSADLNQQVETDSLAIGDDQGGQASHSFSNVPMPSVQPPPLNFAMSSTAANPPASPLQAPASPQPRVKHKEESKRAEQAGASSAESPSFQQEVSESEAMETIPSLKADEPKVVEFAIFRKGDDGDISNGGARPAAAPVAATGEKMSEATASQIKAFTSGWGKSSGAATGIKDKAPTDGQLVDAAPTKNWDNDYLSQSLTELRNNHPANVDHSPAPFTGDRRVAGAPPSNDYRQNNSIILPSEELPGRGTAVLALTPNGDAEFDGYINYGAPLSPAAPVKALEAVATGKLNEEAQNFSDKTQSKQSAQVSVGADAVTLLPLSHASESLLTKEYPVPPNFLSLLSESGNRSGAKEYFESLGVTFPAGASVTHLASGNKLVVRNSAANMELVDNLVEIKLSTPEPPPQSAEIQTAKQPFSTFSLHVSDVSFQLAKDALAKGTVPDPARIRAEEFYNAFDYNDPAPAVGEPVAARIEQSAHPFRQQRDLVRIALKVAAVGRAAGQPLRLTILLDTSGSMEREDRAASVRRALKTLATLLGPNDRVTLIGFARTPRLLAEQVSGDQADKLVGIADRTPSEGGTNLESALALASEMALKQKLPAAQNRIVLLTDGAANLGSADPARLAKQIESTRQQGISFDACGVGANGLNDGMLEALTRKGDGRYYFINRPEDADAGFARQLAGALRPAAENVKVQVVFNPARVKQYRLIGFEKHLLKKEDFRNDKVQAAELSAEEAGIALYQVETLPEGEGELGQVFVRFRDPATGSMVERSWPMPFEAKPRAFDQASPSMQLAATAALLAEKLRGDSQVDLNALGPVIHNLRGHYPNQARVTELIQMIERLRVTKP